jgi:hypothetical protein
MLNVQFSRKGHRLQKYEYLRERKALPGIVYPGGPGYDLLCIIDLAWQYCLPYFDVKYPTLEYRL